jgi:sec-independent protein translocase protein TatB
MEIMVVSVLALIVFGPDKLPEIARTVGGFVKQLRAMADDVKQEFSEGFEVEDEPDDEEVAALAADDSEVARLDDSSDSPETPAAPRPEPETDGHSEHPVAGAIRANREKSSRTEGT